MMQGELDVVLDLVNNLDDGRHMDYRILASSRPRTGNALMQVGRAALTFILGKTLEPTCVNCVNLNNYGYV